LQKKRLTTAERFDVLRKRGVNVLTQFTQVLKPSTA
jgi:hypothetical protein